jgi:Double zinc ribbon
MFCSQCGTKAQTSAKFCHACGAPLVVVSPDPASSGEAVLPSKQQVDSSERRAVPVAVAAVTWRCPGCRQLNRPGTAICVCGQPYQSAQIVQPPGHSTQKRAAEPTLQGVGNPSFSGRGSDIFSIAGLKMLLWYVSIVGIPVGWIYTLRWMIKNINLPGGPQLSFKGTASDAYGYFVIMFAFSLINRLDPTKWEVFSDTDPALFGLGALVVWVGLLAAQGFLYWHMYKWVCANVVSTSGTQMTFGGGPWQYVGWTVLQVLSIFTVVGWAWVQTAFFRWQLKRTHTSNIHLGFRGSGFGLLWRTVGATAVSVLILPLPWVVAYMYGWVIKNIEVQPVDLGLGA